MVDLEKQNVGRVLGPGEKIFDYSTRVFTADDVRETQKIYFSNVVDPMAFPKSRRIYYPKLLQPLVFKVLRKLAAWREAVR